MNFVFLYCTENYPNNFSANNTKISILSKSLVKLGYRACIVNNPKFSREVEDITRNIADVQVVDFSSGKTYFENTIRLRKVLRELFINGDSNFVFYSCGSFQNSLAIHYYAISIGYQIGYIYQEWHWGLERTFKGKINAFLLDFCLLANCDFVLPISEFLRGKICKKKGKVFKLPIIYDYSDNVSYGNKDRYIVYCASIAYVEIIDFVLKMFLLIDDKSIQLKIVLYGDNEQIDKLRILINDAVYYDRVEILTKVSTKDLQSLYNHASILLLPLVPNYLPDIARFSQKIAEYIASVTPILTTNVGEVTYYFEDKKNIFISDFDAKSFAWKCSYILSNEKQARIVTQNALELAQYKFNADIVAEELALFLSNL